MALREEVRLKLTALLRTRDNKKLEELRMFIGKFANVVGIDAKESLVILDRALEEDDREDALRILMAGMEPMIDYQIEHPDIAERFLRGLIIGLEGNIKLSDILYCQFYSESGEVILHMAPAKTLGPAEILKEFRVGMRKLAEDAKKDERIKMVKATSWIVAKNPNLLRRAGFTFEDNISDKARAEQFLGEIRPVAKASMLREVLLERYG